MYEWIGGVMPIALASRWAAMLVALAVASASLVAQQQPTPRAGQGTSAAGQAPVAALTDTGWPRTVGDKTVTMTLYQPQIDKWDGYKLSGRAAVAAQPAGQTSPTFGVIEFAAHTLVNKDTRLVAVERFTVTKDTFPHAEAKAHRWVSLLESRASKLQPIALDRIEAMAAVSSAASRSESMPLRHDAPDIHFSSVPSMLVIVDGPPVFRDVPGTGLERVLNTRPLILRAKSGELYLKIFDGWMQSASLVGEWTVAAQVPRGCDTALRAAIDQKSADLLVGGDPKDASSRPSLETAPPQVLVATRPTELIVTEGMPDYVPIGDTGLLYVKNTTGNVFVLTATQQAFVLISGRWFAGPSTLAGPWTFVANDRLPDAFAKIPDDSPKENVKASVAGTPQASEAVIANGIPQTAKVKRSEAQFKPSIDGQPRIEVIDGTSLRYVVNSSLPIIVVRENHEYFGVQNGVWFVAPGIAGPWLVATTVPAAIYAIPPSSPLHYVTYVRVYDYTPDYVIVGYTPGYTGAYVSSGCVVYGTGYAYTPWIGTVWYGPPVTYGFGVSLAYTPWSGWYVGFGFGWSWGAATVAVGWGWGAYPWWGPSAWGWGYAYPWVYSPVYGAAWGPRGGAVAWGPGYWAGSTGNIYSHWGANTAVTRAWGGYDAWTGNRWAGRSGMAYNSRTGTLAAGQRAAVGNVYTGNYAAGSRGGAYNPSTGTGVVGGRVTAGNAYTGNQISAGRATVVGPGGRTNTISGIHGDDGGIIHTTNNTFAGHDGQVYRHEDGGGWSRWSDGGWQSAGDLGSAHHLDRERNARSVGQGRWDGFHSGAFRGGGMRGGMRGGFRGRR